jgi:hypothetical protein
MNKKNIIITLTVIAIIVILAVLIGYYNYRSNHLFNLDGTVKKGKKAEFIESVNKIEDYQEKLNVLEFGVKSGTITQEEADNLK